MKRLLWIIFSCVAFLVGCAVDTTNEEIYDKGYDGLVSSLNQETLCYNVRYTIENGENDIVSDFTVWQNGVDVYVENTQDHTARLLVDGAVYNYSEETDAWVADDGADSGALVNELLDMYGNTVSEELSWEEAGTGILVSFTFLSEENGVDSYTVSMSFDRDWALTEYTITPNHNGDLEDGFYPVTTEVEFLEKDIIEIRDVIVTAREKATAIQEQSEPGYG